MEDLPSSLLLEILTRIPSSYSISRIRATSRAFNTLATELRTINLQLSYLHYTKSRSPLTKSSITPFKSIFNKLVSESRFVETVTIGVEKGRVHDELDIEDDDDDLFLCQDEFVESWLRKVGWSLVKVSVSDFWVQSCWRVSRVVPLLSVYCPKLLELDIKNAWLSLEGFTCMPKLTTLTLEYIRLDDENLCKLNECFHRLHVLNLIGVGGLKEPRLHLMHLKTCHWALSNAPISISIIAPSLEQLTLRCVKPNLLLIQTPTLSYLNLSLKNAGNFSVKEFSHLENLRLESPTLRSLLTTFPFGTSVKNLTVVSTMWGVPIGDSKSILELLLCTFPNASSLTLTSGVWSEFEAYSRLGVLESRVEMKELKKITTYLSVNDCEVTLSTIFSLLDTLGSLSDMVMFVHRDVVSNVTSSLMSRCTAHCSRVRWKWGMWKEGTEDTWISDGI